jgi:hypothetical protein
LMRFSSSSLFYPKQTFIPLAMALGNGCPDYRARPTCAIASI